MPERERITIDSVSTAASPTRTPRRSAPPVTPVAATGVTGGALLRGVRVGEAAVETESIVMRSRSGTVRTITARHPSGKVKRLRTEGDR